MNYTPDENTVEKMIDFARRLIRTPSLSGEEGPIAGLIKREMEGLGYTNVWRDEVGNIIGRIKGNPDLPAIMFTAHMDSVHPGPLDQWRHDPYGGHIEGDWLFGRGASDTKGAIATQVYIPIALAKSGVEHGDVFVAEVVQEETGGLGSTWLVEHMKVNYAVMGEGTGNELRIGNRGRVLIWVNIPGKKMHAGSASPTDIAHYHAATFLLALQGLPMRHGKLGSSSAVPTLYITDQADTNVTPGLCKIAVDWRAITEEDPNSIIKRIERILPEKATAQIEPFELNTYTGMQLTLTRAQPPYWIDPTHPYVRAVHAALMKGFGNPVPIKYWTFTTDCGLFMEKGIPIIGFSPCEEIYAHTVEDKVSLQMMKEALAAYPRIIEAAANIERANSPKEIA